MDAYDPKHPDYQRELGYRPCRASWCGEIRCHPWHARTAAEIILKKTSQLRGLAEGHIIQRIKLVESAHEHQRQQLVAHGIFPKYEHVTDTGEVLVREWACPRCRGRGWATNPCCGCSLCRGLGVVTATHVQMFALCVQHGRFL